jgi:hypothetical protein
MAVNSTLNELFGINNGIAPASTPTLGYFAIGNGGHKMTIGGNGIAKTDPIQHSGVDAALYNHIPFVLREIANDIISTEQVKYALRRQETHNGRQYIAYYLKRLPLAAVVPDMEYITVANGLQTISSFIPNSSNLNPTPPVLNSSGVNIVSGDYAAASAKINVVLSAADITELLNVATVMYGDPGMAIISEIALCSGVDKMVQSPAASNTMINFNDAVAVQVLSFISSFYALQFNNSGATLLLDLGASEPIFSLI